jgi:hypothetical protein
MMRGRVAVKLGSLISFWMKVPVGSNPTPAKGVGGHGDQRVSKTLGQGSIPCRPATAELSNTFDGCAVTEGNVVSRLVVAQMLTGASPVSHPIKRR